MTSVTSVDLTEAKRQELRAAAMAKTGSTGSAIPSVFERTSATPKPRGKKRKMRSFKIDEISVVDKPAQEHATAVLQKRRTPPPFQKLAGLGVNYELALGDVARFRKAGRHHLANGLEAALALHASATVMKIAGAGEALMSAYAPSSMQKGMAYREDRLARALAKAGKAPSARAPATASAGSFRVVEDEMDKEDGGVFDFLDEEEEDEAEKDADHPERYLPGAEMDKDEMEADDLDLEEMELAEQIKAATAGQNMNDENELFDEDSEIGALANREMKNPKTSKRTALFKAAGRAAASRGLYGKAKARSTTDSEQPFTGDGHGTARRAKERRGLMDRRTVNARNKATADIQAKRSAIKAGANLGREREERRRAIDGAVTKLREQVNPNMTHTNALREVRKAMPELFD